MLNTNFFTILEHAISRALHDTESSETKGFWYDRVLLSEGDDHYLQKSVNDNKQVTLKEFGSRSISRFLKFFMDVLPLAV